jgi:3-oxoacyl-[acyl-carrier-protein] synthase II
MKSKRVVITGIGIVCPVGNTVLEAWTAIKTGQSGIEPIQRIDTSRLTVKIAGEVKNFDPVALYGAKEARRMDRVSHFVLEATRQAMEMSRLVVDDSNHEDIAIITGTGIGGIESVVDSVYVGNSRGPERVGPVALLNWLPDSPPALISMRYRIDGPHFTVAGACASGNIAIGHAADMIRSGACVAAIAGGVEAALTELAFGAFYVMGVLTAENDNPHGACRPFDSMRKGTVLSEGAGILVLEDEEYALERGAQILAEVAGFGQTSDAYHIAAPEPNGAKAARAMQLAMRKAQMKPCGIQAYNAHGTGTTFNDLVETKALKIAFGEASKQLSVSSTKSMTGHLLGGASAVESVFCILSILECFAPPTINLNSPDPELDLDYTPNVGTSREINAVMNYAAGLGGHNAAVIYRRYSAS